MDMEEWSAEAKELLRHTLLIQGNIQAKLTDLKHAHKEIYINAGYQNALRQLIRVHEEGNVALQH